MRQILDTHEAALLHAIDEQPEGAANRPSAALARFWQAYDRHDVAGRIEPWQGVANCRIGPDDNLFFADHGTPHNKAVFTYCRDCPVRTQCGLLGLSSLLDNPERQDMFFGVYGGLTQTRIRKLAAFIFPTIFKHSRAGRSSK